MFGDLGMPMRTRRDLARAVQMHSMMNNANRPMSPYAFDPLSLPTPRPGLGRRNSFGGRSVSDYDLASDHTPSVFSGRSSPPLSATSIGRSRASYRRPENYGGGPASFAKAARTLFDALDPALDFNKEFERTFEIDVGPIFAYVDPKIIEHLWRAKIEWDGVDKWPRHNPGAAPRPDMPCYSDHAARLLDAMETWQERGHLNTRAIYDGNGKLSPQDVLTTVQKLNISLQAIEGLLEAVRMDQKRHKALVRELHSAHALLMDLQELWKQTPERRFGRQR